MPADPRQFRRLAIYVVTQDFIVPLPYIPEIIPAYTLELSAIKAAVSPFKAAAMENKERIGLLLLAEAEESHVSYAVSVYGTSRLRALS